MDEMISRDAVLTILNHNWGKPKGYTQSMEEISELPTVQPRIGSWRMAEEAKLPTVQQTWPDWIPLTKESRPEKGGEYLVEFQGMKVGICQYINGHFRNYGENFDRMITRWMPLPKAKGEET